MICSSNFPRHSLQDITNEALFLGTRTATFYLVSSRSHISESSFFFSLLLLDVAVQLPDKKSIIMYLTSLFEVLPQQVTIDAIREVETLPRKYKKECEGEEINIQVLAHFSRNFGHACLISHRYLVKLAQCVFRTYVCFF